MKRLLFVAVFLWSSRVAFAQTEGMQSNLTGVDPVTNLPTYAIFGLTGFGVGTEAIPSNAQVVIIRANPAGPAELFVSNSSSGTSASAGVLVQASTSDSLGTPPYIGTTVLSPGFIPSISEIFKTAGAGTISYATDGVFGRNLVIDISNIAGSVTPDLLITNQSYGQLLAKLAGATGVLSLPISLGGAGTRCLQTDNSGNVSIAAGACASGSGTVTSVSGTAGRIVVTPSTPNPVVDLATFGTASTCAWANVVTDAWGRTTCTANTAPQPAGSYITSLNHDVTASGPGAATAEVTGITDSGSTDWQVTGTFANGKALGFVAGGLQAVSFQAPLIACTDYVSLSCQAGTSDIANTNGDVHVDAIHEIGGLRIPVGACTTDGQAFVKVAGQMTCRLPSADLSNDYTAPWVTAIHESSGPTQLAIAGIPDLSPLPDVLVRDGVGANTIIGLPPSAIADYATKHDYFVNTASLQPADTTRRYAATSQSLMDYSGVGAIEYPNDFIAGHVAYKFNIIQSVGVASSMDCWATRNGSNISASDFNFTPGTTATGVYTVAAVATGSSSASDVFGFACTYNGSFTLGPFGASIAFSVQMVLTP